MKKNSHFPAVLRVTAAVLIATFAAEQAGWAAPEAAKMEWSKPSSARYALPVPPSVAVLDEAWFGGKGPTLFLLQDAHTNPSAQLNLAQTLDALFQADPGLRTVFVEAGFGNDTLWPVRKFTSDNDRARLAKAELRKGLLHGEEYLSLTGETPFAVWGVEDRALYDKAVEAYRETSRGRPKLEAALDRIQNAQTYLQGRVLNPVLLAFDKARLAYEAEKLPLTAYLETLEKNRRDLSLDISSPELDKLAKLRAVEASIDFDAARAQQAAALVSLPEEAQAELERAAHRPGAFRASDSRDGDEAYWALFEEEIENGAAAYPALAAYLDYRKKTRALKLPAVLSEIKSLEAAVLGALALNDDERTFVDAEKLLSLQRKLFAFTLTNDEYDAYRALSRDLGPRRLLGFLNRRLMEEGGAPEKALFIESTYEPLAAQAESFYQITLDRDEAFLKNLFPKLAETGAQKAVLVAGGYHTKNLKELLKARGVSYISIVPQVMEETNRSRYEQILLAGSSDRSAAPALKMAATGRLARPLALLDSAASGARLAPYVPAGSIAALREAIKKAPLSESLLVPAPAAARLSRTGRDPGRLHRKVQPLTDKLARLIRRRERIGDEAGKERQQLNQQITSISESIHKLLRGARLPDVRVSSTAQFAQKSAAIGDEIVRLQLDPSRIVNVMFATGNTQIGMLDALSRDTRIDWSRVRAFHQDEYKGLSIDHPSSFALYMRKTLFSKVALPAENVFYIDGENPEIPGYMDRIHALGGLDILIHGIGKKGHLAFNENGSSFNSRMHEQRLDEQTILDNEKDYPGIADNPYAITIGLADTMDAHKVFLLANGEGKAEIIARALNGPVTEEVPASILQLHPNVTVVLDDAAASGLSLRLMAQGADGARLAESDDPMEGALRLRKEVWGKLTELSLLHPDRYYSRPAIIRFFPQTGESRIKSVLSNFEVAGLLESRMWDRGERDPIDAVGIDSTTNNVTLYRISRGLIDALKDPAKKAAIEDVVGSAHTIAELKTGLAAAQSGARLSFDAARRGARLAGAGRVILAGAAVGAVVFGAPVLFALLITGNLFSLTGLLKIVFAGGFLGAATGFIRARSKRADPPEGPTSFGMATPQTLEDGLAKESFEFVMRAPSNPGVLADLLRRARHAGAGHLVLEEARSGYSRHRLNLGGVILIIHHLRIGTSNEFIRLENGLGVGESRVLPHQAGMTAALYQEIIRALSPPPGARLAVAREKVRSYGEPYQAAKNLLYPRLGSFLMTGEGFEKIAHQLERLGRDASSVYYLRGELKQNSGSAPDMKGYKFEDADDYLNAAAAILAEIGREEGHDKARYDVYVLPYRPADDDEEKVMILIQAKKDSVAGSTPAGSEAERLRTGAELVLAHAGPKTAARLAEWRVISRLKDNGAFISDRSVGQEMAVFPVDSPIARDAPNRIVIRLLSVNQSSGSVTLSVQAGGVEVRHTIGMRQSLIDSKGIVISIQRFQPSIQGASLRILVPNTAVIAEAEKLDSPWALKRLAKYAGTRPPLKPSSSTGARLAETNSAGPAVSGVQKAAVRFSLNPELGVRQLVGINGQMTYVAPLLNIAEPQARFIDSMMGLEYAHEIMGREPDIRYYVVFSDKGALAIARESQTDWRDEMMGPRNTPVLFGPAKGPYVLVWDISRLAGFRKVFDEAKDGWFELDSALVHLFKKTIIPRFVAGKPYYDVETKRIDGETLEMTISEKRETDPTSGQPIPLVEISNQMNRSIVEYRYTGNVPLSFKKVLPQILTFENLRRGWLNHNDGGMFRTPLGEGQVGRVSINSVPAHWKKPSEFMALEIKDGDRISVQHAGARLAEGLPLEALEQEVIDVLRELQNESVIRIALYYEGFGAQDGYAWSGVIEPVEIAQMVTAFIQGHGQSTQERYDVEVERENGSADLVVRRAGARLAGKSLQELAEGGRISQRMLVLLYRRSRTTDNYFNAQILANDLSKLGVEQTPLISAKKALRALQGKGWAELKRGSLNTPLYRLNPTLKALDEQAFAAFVATGKLPAPAATDAEAQGARLAEDSAQKIDALMRSHDWNDIKLRELLIYLALNRDAFPGAFHISEVQADAQKNGWTFQVSPYAQNNKGPTKNNIPMFATNVRSVMARAINSQSDLVIRIVGSDHRIRWEIVNREAWAVLAAGKTPQEFIHSSVSLTYVSAARLADAAAPGASLVTRDAYDRNGAAFRTVRGENLQSLEENVFADVQRKIHALFGGRDVRLLDTGAGYGKFASRWQQVPGMEVWASDQSATMVGLLKKETGIVPARVLQADTAKMPFQNAFFDVVFAHAVYHHIDDPREAFAEAARVLKPGGLFYVFVRRGSFIGNRDEGFGPMHYRYYEEKELEGLLEGAGFTVDEIRPIDDPYGAGRNVNFLMALAVKGSPNAGARLAEVGAMKAIEDIPRFNELKPEDIRGKTFVVRANENVRIVDGVPQDPTRLLLNVPVLKKIIDNGGTAVVLGHNGRYDKNPAKDDRQSLEPVAAFYGQQGLPTVWHAGSIDNEKGLVIGRDAIQPGKVNVLENVRFAQDFETGEKAKKLQFAAALATLGDYYVFEGYGDLNSSGASVESLPLYMHGAFIGPQTVRELAETDRVLSRNFAAVLFGSGPKVTDKALFVPRFSRMLTPNGFIFFASGPTANLGQIQKEYDEIREKVRLTLDFSDQTPSDIGPKTVAFLSGEMDALAKGDAVLVNGTMGWVDKKTADGKIDTVYQAGTRQVFEMLKEAALRGVTVALVGGDTNTWAREFGLENIPNVVSFSGGGVPLAILAGERLKAAQALRTASIGRGARLAEKIAVTGEVELSLEAKTVTRDTVSGWDVVAAPLQKLTIEQEDLLDRLMKLGSADPILGREPREYLIIGTLQHGPLGIARKMLEGSSPETDAIRSDLETAGIRTKPALKGFVRKVEIVPLEHDLWRGPNALLFQQRLSAAWGQDIEFVVNSDRTLISNVRLQRLGETVRNKAQYKVLILTDGNEPDSAPSAARLAEEERSAELPQPVEYQETGRRHDQGESGGKSAKQERVERKRGEDSSSEGARLSGFAQKLLTFAAAVTLFLPATTAHAYDMPVQNPSGAIQQVLLERVSGTGYATIDGTRTELGAAQAQEKISQDSKALSDADLDRIRTAEALVANVADLETPYILAYDTNIFVGDKMEISNFVKQMASKAGKNAQILVLGPHASLVTSEARNLGVSLNFISSIGPEQGGRPVSIVTNVAGYAGWHEQYPDARIATVAPAVERGQAGYFAAGPLTSYAKLLLQNKLDTAREFFHRMTGFDPSVSEFNELTAGSNPVLAERYAIQPLFRNITQYLRKAWTAARTLAIAA